MVKKGSTGENIREEGVNVTLAQLLRNRGLKARGERRSKKGVPDIRVDLKGGDSLLVECKWEGSTSLLEDQLEGRLENFPDAIGVIGVLYPARLKQSDDTQEALENATDLQWWLHGSRSVVLSERRVRAGSVADFADHLRTLPLELEGVDRVTAAANAVGIALDGAKGPLKKHARISRRVADLVAETDQEKDVDAALSIGCLVVFNALAFQDRLAAANEKVSTVGEALTGGVLGLCNTWRYICHEIDYVPVFELAAKIVDVVVDGPEDVQLAFIGPLVKAMEDTRRLEGHDLSGRLFHTLLTDAKFTGAYYTSVPAATLLTRLVFDGWPEKVDWADHEFPASLDVADLACGTGTLLMAVAVEAERRHTDAGGKNPVALHKAMVEQALHGYDVQLSAVHFAATSLAMLNPEIQFNDMDLNVLPLGVAGATCRLGSLDFLGSDEVPVQTVLSERDMGVEVMDAAQVSGSGHSGAKEGNTARLPDLDLAIMNPPFTRSVGGNLLFGSLPPQVRRKLQDELSRRLRTRQASATAGLGSAFVVAASRKLRPGEGRLALVLPITVCTGPSWQQTRTLIEQQFTLDMVITSHDPRRWCFSDSTDLSEVLLIATRRGVDGETLEHRTTFVNLWENPATVLDAHRMAQAVATTQSAKLEEVGTAILQVDGRQVGEILSVRESGFAGTRGAEVQIASPEADSKPKGTKWSGVQFSRADLLRSASSLLDEKLVWVPGSAEKVSVDLTELKALGAVGPDRRDVWDGFERTDSVTAYPMVENHDTEQKRRLSVEPDKYLAPLVKARPGRHLKPLAQLWPKAGRMLVGERLWLETTRVVAMWSECPVLSNVWWSVRIEDEETEKGLVVWLNSTLGLLSLLAHRTSTRGGWVAMKKADIEVLPVLDVRQLSISQRSALAHLYNSLAEAEFERLSCMAQCPARKALDDGVCEVLGLPDLSALRALVASEPVVSNEPLSRG